MMKRVAPLALLCLVVAVSAGAEDSAWSGYLDYAYVYSSAEPEVLRARLDQYGGEAGIRLEDYVVKRFGAGSAKGEVLEEAAHRRAGIAHLLLYLASGEPDALDQSVDSIRQLEDHLSRHENRYWYHYILAHRALETGQRYDFVGELLDLWLRVVVPLESPYETLQTLSLSDAPNSGFVSALPYIYENVARLILIRSQQMGIDRDLDPLGAIVRLLHDGRVGSHSDVIPVELTSREYLARIVSRLDGPESDAGSLTFTLALFEASKYHDRARALLASNGLDAETVKALRVTSGAYETALNRAQTLQGQSAVYTRVLRQLGEVYAAKQRLGVDPDIETSFSIEGAIDVYRNIQRKGREDWHELGYATREQYVTATHRLWSEIQEVSLNAADYYLTRAVEQPHIAAERSRSAARIYARYLAFFHRFARADAREAVPDSAYFAAYEAARGFGDALTRYAPGRVSGKEMDLATRRYVSGLRLFPFDRGLWSSLTAALERQGRESDYLDLVRPVAESVTRSRHVNSWIESQEPGARRIAVLRRAFADSQALVYLGFAEDSDVAVLEASIGELRVQRDGVQERLAALSQRREAYGHSVPAAPDPGAASDSQVGELAELELSDVASEIADSGWLIERLDKQIAARKRALPLYKATLGADGLADELRARRDHPVHTLLRRMFHETSS